MPEPTRGDYLARLDDVLPFPPERRAEIVEEIAAHLDDAVADRVERGGSRDEAEHAAQTRLGDPVDLARDLARSEQSTRRLLAAAGAGVRASVGPWIYGFLFAAIALVVVFVALSSIMQLARNLTGFELSPQAFNGGWNSAITAGAVALGLYFAGRSATEAVSQTSHRLLADVRPWVAVVGTSLAAWVLVVVMEQPQNAASVTGFILAPFAFALGAYRPDLLPRRLVASWLLIGALLLLIPIGLATAGTSGSSEPMEIDDAAWNRRTEVIGPWWRDPLSTEMPILTSSSWGTLASGATHIEWELSSPTALQGLHGLRAEAWHADPQTEWLIDPRFNEPFATSPVRRNGTTLTASVVTTDEPGVGNWQIALTGVGADGVRYVIDASMGGNSTFTGTPLDWIVASTDDD